MYNFGKSVSFPYTCFLALAMAQVSLKQLKTIVLTSPKKWIWTLGNAMKCLFSDSSDSSVKFYKCVSLADSSWIEDANYLRRFSPEVAPGPASAQPPSKVLGPRIYLRFPNDHLRYAEICWDDLQMSGIILNLQQNHRNIRPWQPPMRLRSKRTIHIIHWEFATLRAVPYFWRPKIYQNLAVGPWGLYNQAASLPSDPDFGPGLLMNLLCVATWPAAVTCSECSGVISSPLIIGGGASANCNLHFRGYATSKM